jgi:GTP-binding protein
MRVLARFMMSVSDPSQFPAPVLPEVAFLGRSNVGKSSVINSLLGNKIAKTSSTPGRTRSINFFEIRWPGKPEPELIFTDLPGYGYAKISREISQQWPSFIDPYLKERACLALCIVLVDVNVPPQPADRQLLDFLTGIGRPTLIVATKSDRLSGNQLRNALQTLAREYPESHILPFSARTGAGRPELWQEIRQQTSDLGLQASALQDPDINLQ